MQRLTEKEQEQLINELQQENQGLKNKIDSIRRGLILVANHSGNFEELREHVFNVFDVEE